MEGCGARESPAEDVSSGSTTANGPCCVAEMAAIGLAHTYYTYTFSNFSRNVRSSECYSLEY